MRYMSESKSLLPDGWHLDKRIPIALILAVLMQGLAAAWYAATLSSRVDAIDRRTANLEARDDQDRSASRDLARDIGEIKAQLKILLERMK